MSQTSAAPSHPSTMLFTHLFKPNFFKFNISIKQQDITRRLPAKQCEQKFFHSQGYQEEETSQRFGKQVSFSTAACRKLKIKKILFPVLASLEFQKLL